MTAFIVKRGDDVVGYLTDAQLAEAIDGDRISNDASDPAYRETAEYTVEEVPNEDVF